jgi:LysR family transcriptional regulator, carnitine catabolism transcriptional activator
LRKNPLSKKEEIKLNDLDGETIIKPIESDHVVYQESSLRRVLGHQLQSSLSSIGAMIEFTGGVSLMNVITAADLCDNNKLVSRRFAVDQWFNFFLVCKQELSNDRLVADVRTALRQVVIEMQQRKDCEGSLNLL